MSAASLAGRAAFPGDVIASVSDFERVSLGPGVFREGEQLLAACVGVLQWDATACKLWVRACIACLVRVPAGHAAAPRWHRWRRGRNFCGKSF